MGGTFSLVQPIGRCALAIGPDLQRLITAGRDNRLRVWRLSDLALVGSLDLTDLGLDQVVIAPNTRVAYSIFGDTIVAWDVHSLSFDHQLTAIAVADDGAGLTAVA